MSWSPWSLIPFTFFLPMDRACVPYAVGGEVANICECLSLVRGAHQQAWVEHANDVLGEVNRAGQ
jgi:hypothetical protein